ncbi:hypothetical protein WJX79_000324 [Trebouxia sp. C0005]
MLRLNLAHLMPKRQRETLCELHSTVGDVATAVSLFDRAAGIDPSNGRIFQQRGGCKPTLGDYAGCVADLTAAIQLGRDDSKSYVYRGIANMKLKCLAAALADLSQAVLLNPDNDEAFAFRAEVKSLMGDRRGAVEDMDGAHRASVKMGLTDYLGALQDLDVVDQLGGFTDKANVLKMRSLVNGQLGNKHEALYLMDQAVLLQPRNGELLQHRGAMKSHLQDWHGALADRDAALEHGTKTPTSFCLRGSVLCTLGNESKALIDLNMAHVLCPNDVETFTWRAYVNSDVGNY